jgi:hypothetical protein
LSSYVHLFFFISFSLFFTIPLFSFIHFFTILLSSFLCLLPFTSVPSIHFFSYSISFLCLLTFTSSSLNFFSFSFLFYINYLPPFSLLCRGRSMFPMGASGLVLNLFIQNFNINRTHFSR